MAMEIVTTDEVLNAAQVRGPALPLELKKVIGKGDSITIGAAISQLLKQGRIKVTDVKKGGSPFYYVSGQEPKLELVAGNLNEKDKQTYDILKEKKVLRDKTQEPITRVGLRQIKDYSRLFTVTVNSEKEIFWRYYLVSEQEAIQILKERFAPKTETVKVPEKTEEKSSEATKDASQPKQETESSQKKELQKSEKQTTQKPKSRPQNSDRRTPAAEEQKSLDDSYETLLQETEDEFLDQINNFFKENQISVHKADMIRKGSEYEFIISMQTPMGSAEYYCKAKSKKKSADGDLSQAYVQGQTRRLPTVYLTTGDIAKKSMEKLKTDYKGMLLKQI